MSDPSVNDIPAIVDAEASRRAEDVAKVAAAQIDQANKDAEAIARAAQQTDLGSRIQSNHEENLTWRATLEQRLMDQKAEAAAASEALKQSILDAISMRQSTPPVVVEAPPPEAASVSDEQKPNSKPTDTTPAATAKRRRVLL